MKSAKIVLAAAMLAVLLPVTALADDDGAQLAKIYADLVAKAQNGDADVDYNKLRLAYPFSPDYDPYSHRTRELFDETWKALQAKDCATVMAKSDEYLKIDFVRAPIHLMREDCYEQAGDTKNAARELAIGRGLTLSLLNSGDGKSPATAYVVVALHEEGYLLASLDRREAGQALLQNNGKMYDLIQAADKDGKTIGVLFDVTGPFIGMSRKLESGKSLP